MKNIFQFQFSTKDSLSVYYYSSTGSYRLQEVPSLEVCRSTCHVCLEVEGVCTQWYTHTPQPQASGAHLAT